MAQRMLDERSAEPQGVASTLSNILPWGKSAGSVPPQEKLSYQVRKDRILLVCMAIEDEKATLVQRMWRHKMAMRRQQLEYRSATKLQAAMRGKLARTSFMPEHKVKVLIVKRAVRKLQQYFRLTLARNVMKKQCRGVIEKQGQIAIPMLGSMELVIWQARFVYATDHSLCYQRLSKDRTTSALKRTESERTNDLGIESTTKARPHTPPHALTHPHPPSRTLSHPHTS